MTQTMIEILESVFEPIPKKNANPETLAEAISNELTKVMPRISPDLFERKREADIVLTPTQMKELTPHYRAARNIPERCTVNDFACTAIIPIFAYARVPATKEVMYENVGVVSNAELLKLNTDDGQISIVQGGYWRSDDELAGRYTKWHYNNDRNLTSDKKPGVTQIEVKSTWTAPFKLNVCVLVPEVPDEIAALGDEALFAYFERAKRIKKKSSVAKPCLGVLWAPTDESLYCTGCPPRPAKKDPALVLEIPDTTNTYRHVIATWNIGEERPFKNWLAEYTE